MQIKKFHVCGKNKNTIIIVIKYCSLESQAFKWNKSKEGLVAIIITFVKI